MCLSILLAGIEINSESNGALFRDGSRTQYKGSNALLTFQPSKRVDAGTGLCCQQLGIFKKQLLRCATGANWINESREFNVVIGVESQ